MLNCCDFSFCVDYNLCMVANSINLYFIVAGIDSFFHVFVVTKVTEKRKESLYLTCPKFYRAPSASPVVGRNGLLCA